MKRLITICAVAGLMAFATSAAYAVLPSDNFNDNSRDTSMWNLYQDDPCNAWLDETGGRLEFHSTASADDVVALYIANDWGFLPTADFSFNVDFHYSSTSGPPGSDASVMFGLGKDENNYVTIDAGNWVDGGAHPYFYYEQVTGGSEVAEGEKARGLIDGTLYISYDASEDDLYLSDTGYWSGAAWVTILDLLQDEWGGAIVGPFLGGWSEEMTLASGEAYLDNFVVESGTIVPEPATIALLGLGALSLLRRRKK